MKTTTKPHTAPAHILRPARPKVPAPTESEQATQKAVRRAMYLARAVNARTPPRLIANASSGQTYAGDELKPYIGRPDAQHAFGLPSRTGSRLRYPDGRVTDLAGNLLDDSRSNP
ncbi:hypothetical protein [Polaromonas sp.]|uniref:hypothetical protein n=1 Tax=Polaromonas sp. TaxID=1869339 RepID=UPI003BB67DF3